MLRVYIFAAGAVLVMALGSAAAQTAPPAAPGKPIQLLQLVHQPAKVKTRTKAKLHIKPARTGAKTARKTAFKKHRAFAAAKSPHWRRHAAAAAAPAKTWPAADTALPAQTPPANTVPADLPTAEPAAAAFAEPVPSELVVGGETVKVDAPEAVNAIDLAADSQKKAAKTARPDDVIAAAPVAATAPAIAAAPAANAIPLPPVQQTTNRVGSASWIAQVLAALGGAVAAGSIAWFLIAAGPQRTYG